MTAMRVLPDRVYGPESDERAHWLPNGIEHPAKMAPALLVDLVRRYTLPGQTILDPFGGIGTTLLALAQDRNVVLVELEAKFVAHARANLARIRWLLDVLGRPYGQGVVHQGDSRRLPLPSARCDGIVGSPPYGDQDLVLPMHKKIRGDLEAKYGRSFAHSMAPGEGYSDAANLGNLARGDVDGVIGSPPFGEMNAADAGGTITQRPARDGDGFEGGREEFVYSEATPGQIGNLPLGDVSAILTSPPYADTASRDRSHEDYAAAHPEYARDYGRTAEAANRSIDGYGRAPGQIGNLHHGGVEWQESESQTGVQTAVPHLAADDVAPATEQHPTVLSEPQSITERSGIQIAVPRVPTGKVAHTHCGEVIDGSRFTEQSENGMDDVSSVELPSNSVFTTAGRGEKADQRHQKISPPSASGATSEATDTPSIGTASAPFVEWSTDHEVRSTVPARQGVEPSCERKPFTVCTRTRNRDEPLETYSSAMLRVFCETYRVVRPGGVMVIVCGNYIRDGKLVDLAADTIKLAQAAGWTPVERWRACKTQISFWRRLHAKQRPEVPVVTWEDVLVFVKQYQGWEFQELAPTTRRPVALDQANRPADPDTAQAPLPLG